MRLFIPILLAWAAMAAPLEAQTVQQRFDAARQKLDAKDGAGALAALKALEAFLLAQPKPNETNLAITRAQLGEAFVLLGRGDEARPVLRAALAGGGLDKPELAIVKDNARLLLANVAEGMLEHAAARAEYLRLAGDTAEPVTRTVALMGAARTGMFTDAPAALRDVDAALAIAEKNLAVGKRELANVLGLKGRILTNNGQFAAARALLARAVSLRGGLTQRVYQQDVALRADAAVAMLQLGQAEDARKYLAYTGAGRTEVQLEPAVDMPLPACGEEGLEPGDSAVVQFAILDDGRVIGAQPVYASKQGEAAYVFARAVNGWSWQPENASKVKPFFRLSTRVEVQCSNQVKRPPMTMAFERGAAEWFRAKGVAPLAKGSDAELAIEIGKRLREPAAADPERLMLLMASAGNSTLESEVKLARAAEAVKVARQINAPPDVIFLAALRHAVAHAYGNGAGWSSRNARLFDNYTAMRDDPVFAAPAMQAVLNLQIANAAGELKRRDAEQQALTLIAESKGLNEHDPLKVAALVQLANLYAARKDAAQASAMYDRTGLTAKQCALVDGGPVMMRQGTGEFPMEAYAWGFEGWTALEYDVAADGSTRNQRAVAAFPPRIFAKASEQLARTVKYRVSYRPEGDLACTAMQRRVRFTIP